ncbi:HD-GYP domain-containing protein [Natroniella acetigena]|uniref:HD-GYP domain-containing protein n=1 Tax=Natroniella acetigena TaxID=52004 RepID=UPI00200A6A6F|nr:HD-GYP domain-containing protein [Natroniella acetigena]MCK8826815.1 HD-GYP domain-containing protein [Natroniella acetigena]
MECKSIELNHGRCLKCNKNREHCVMANFKTISNALNNMMQKRDPYTVEHQKRVATLAVEMAKVLDFPKERIDIINMAAVIHDIGKVNVPMSILTKPTKLNEHEFNMIKTHSEVGYEIIADTEFPGKIAEIIRQHHERLDGSGYPLGLKEDEILIEAKIIAVADVVEAMNSHRPYRPALGVEKALNEIKRNRGKSYDCEVVDVCLELFLKDDFKIKDTLGK